MSAMTIMNSTHITHYVFNTYWNVTRGIILFCSLLVLFPIFNIFYNLCCTKKQHRNNEDQSFIQSKIILSLSIICYMTFITILSYETIVQYTNLHLNKLLCTIAFSMSAWTFLLGKALLYNYFILRSNDTFYNTAYQFNPYFIQLILPIELIIIFIFLLPMEYSLLYNNTLQIEIESTPYNHGSICVLSFSENLYYDLYFYCIGGGLIEIIFSIFTLRLLVNKIIAIIQFTTKDIEIYKSLINNDCPTLSIHTHLSAATTITNTTTDSIQETDSNIVTHTADRIIGFHSDTANTNHLLLLITKLSTLMFVQIMFIAIAMICYFTTQMRFGYIINAVSDIYCLWLTFKFSSKYYYECCLGAQCTKCCFPFVKTRALAMRHSCCDFDDSIRDEETFGDFYQVIFYPKCRFLCCLCCCSRLYVMKSGKRKQIFSMAKSEIDLLLATKLEYKRRVDQDVWN
eukprot:501786_1